MPPVPLRPVPPDGSRSAPRLAHAAGRGPRPRAGRARRALGPAPALLALMLGLLSCSPAAEPPRDPAAPAVAATTPSLATFARRLLETDLSLALPLPPGADPARWMPDDPALVRLQSAGLLLCQGAGYEPWLDSASLSRSRLVETARAVESAWIEFETVTHSHGTGEHSHAGLYPQTWLDPLLAREQARHAAAAIGRRYPELEARLGPRLAALEAELEALDRGWRALAPRLMRARLLCSHPSYAYLARRYGLALETVLLDPSRPLGESERAALGARRGAGPALLWFEREPAPELAAQLQQEFDLEAVWVDPVDLEPGPDPSGEDALARQHQNLRRLEAALAQRGL